MDAEIRALLPENQQEGEKIEEEKSWAGLVGGNKFAAKGMVLTYIPPVLEEGEIVVNLEEEDVAEGNKKWEAAIVIYVVGNAPTMAAMNRFMTTNWNFVQKPQLWYHNDGYFVARFSKLQDVSEVMFSGPYSINNRPMIIKQWTPDFNFGKEVLSIIPLWIRLPNLPLNCWNGQALSKIASGLGKPMYADACTSKVDRISYARLLVEMDVTRILPGSIKLKDPQGRLVHQTIVYDWKPSFCPTCCQVGHNCQAKEVLKMAREEGKKQANKQTQWKKTKVRNPADDQIDTQGRELIPNKRKEAEGVAQDQWTEVRPRGSPRPNNIASTSTMVCKEANNFNALTGLDGCDLSEAHTLDGLDPLPSLS